MNLERFARDCHDILAADPGPAGRQKVRALLEQALRDREFVETSVNDAMPERNLLYEDPALGFCILAHNYTAAKDSPPLDLQVVAASQRPKPSTLFWQGALSATTNPKGILFFAAFLPQFIDPARSLLIQFLVMAGTFAGTEALTEIVLARTAHRIRPWLARVGKRFNHACGGLFMAIGAALPLRT